MHDLQDPTDESHDPSDDTPKPSKQCPGPTEPVYKVDVDPKPVEGSSEGSVVTLAVESGRGLGDSPLRSVHPPSSGESSGSPGEPSPEGTPLTARKLFATPDPGMKVRPRVMFVTLLSMSAKMTLMLKRKVSFYFQTISNCGGAHAGVIS